MLISIYDGSSRSEIDSGEAWIWAQITSNLIDESIRDYVPRLANSGSIILNKREVDASFASPMLGRTILNRIIIPYLAPSPQ